MFNLIHLVMREEFLYHIWKFQKFDPRFLVSTAGENLKVYNPGIQNQLAGPDFFNARIQIDEQLWAGNVEVHLKSSDWYAHQHETDPNYDNVILHVVWEQDVDVFRRNGSVIPTLVLNGLVENGLLDSYQKLLGINHYRINCEEQFPVFSDFSLDHWLERLYIERLEQKSETIEASLKKSGNNWEASLFIHLFESFGLNVNGECFMAIARSIPFKLVQKTGQSQQQLEALFLGQAGLLEGDDKYVHELKKGYAYIKHKHQLENKFLPRPQFFRLRPNNFPGIRLAQLAALYHKRQNLFADLMEIQEMEEMYRLFDIELSDYWQTHFNFGSPHKRRTKKISKAFIDLLAINCLIPIKALYFSFIGKKEEGQILELISQIAPETNTQVALFNSLRPGTAKTALHSQALLQLKKEYCDRNRCLSCELGASLLKGSTNYR